MSQHIGENPAIAVVFNLLRRIHAQLHCEAFFAAVRAHCTAAGLARFKVPDRVIAVGELPILTVGKPNRAALRELLLRSGGS